MFGFTVSHITQNEVSETTTTDPGLKLNVYHMDLVMGYVGALNSHSSHMSNIVYN